MERQLADYLGPGHLAGLAVAEYRLAIGLALVAFLLAATLAASRRERPWLAAVLPVTCSAAIYLWALHGTLSFLALLDRIGMAPRRDEVFEVAMIQAVALAGVLLPVTAGMLLAGRKATWHSSHFVGPVAALATMFIDWVFYLVLFSAPWLV